MKKQLISFMFIFCFIYLILFKFFPLPIHAGEEKTIILNGNTVDCPYQLAHQKGELLIPIEWFAKNINGTDFSYSPETKRFLSLWIIISNNKSISPI